MASITLTFCSVTAHIVQAIEEWQQGEIIRDDAENGDIRFFKNGKIKTEFRAGPLGGYRMHP